MDKDESVMVENCEQLPIEFTSVPPTMEDDIYVIELPSKDQERIDFSFLDNLTKEVGSNAIVAVVGDPANLARVHFVLSKVLYYQIWLVIQCPTISTSKQRIPCSHYGVLIYSKYKGPLKHCVMRGKYTYCPICDKTTKDYGGKKHTYHHFGTLISDVWRDIQDKNQLYIRLSMLFGLKPHSKMVIWKITDCYYKPVTQYEINTVLGKTPKVGIRLGDCLDQLKQIPDNSIDFCFADPPYNIKKKYSNYNDNLEINNYFKWCDEWLYELKRVLKPGRTLAILNIPLWSIRHFECMENILQFQNWIVWDGPSLPVRKIMPSHYSILCFTKGVGRDLPLYDQQGITEVVNVSKTFSSLKPLKQGYCLRNTCVGKRKNNEQRKEVSDIWLDIHRLKHNERRVDHPCQLPPTLMYRLYSIFTYSGETILDCFNGVGTSSLTAAQLNRSYIGIELSEKYYNLSLQRHAELDACLDPFRKGNRVIEEKNSRVPRQGKQLYKYSKKTLQLDIRKVKDELGHIPTRNEYLFHGTYDIEFFDKYFLNWGEACAAARTTGMSETKID